MTEGHPTHLLMQARQPTEGRPELARVQHLIEAALLIVRKVHRG